MTTFDWLESIALSLMGAGIALYIGIRCGLFDGGDQ